MWLGYLNLDDSEFAKRSSLFHFFGTKLGNFLIVVAVMHFYFMEIRSNWSLNVRPYGMLPFVTAALALVEINYPGFWKDKLVEYYKF